MYGELVFSVMFNYAIILKSCDFEVADMKNPFTVHRVTTLQTSGHREFIVTECI